MAQPGLSHDPTRPLFQALSGLGFPSRRGVRQAGQPGQVNISSPAHGWLPWGPHPAGLVPAQRWAVPLPSRQCRAHLLGPVPPQVPPCGEQSRAWLSILHMRKPRPRKGMPYLRVWLNPNQLTVFVYFFKIMLFLAMSGLSCGTWAPEHVGSVVVAHRLSCSMVCRILVPPPGIKSLSRALDTRDWCSVSFCTHICAYEHVCVNT